MAKNKDKSVEHGFQPALDRHNTENEAEAAKGSVPTVVPVPTTEELVQADSDLDKLRRDQASKPPKKPKSPDDGPDEADSEVDEPPVAQAPQPPQQPAPLPFDQAAVVPLDQTSLPPK